MGVIFTQYSTPSLNIPWVITQRRRYGLVGTSYLAAYEFSPVLEHSGKHHRNVIFNGSQLPEHAISAFDVSNAIDLWRGLEETCTGDCDFLTIPHNMNKGWGLFYSPNTWDGGTYSEDDWRVRMRREPLAEMYQVKGASECALGVGATDEECAFEQVLTPCEQGQESGCAFETSFARQGLQIGMQLDRELGFNPLAFGFVAATDAHNANPGDAEDDIKAIIEGKNGVIIDVDMTSVDASVRPSWIVCGTRGTLWIQDGQIHLKYIHAKRLPKLEPIDTHLALGRKYGAQPEPDRISWREEVREVKPRKRYESYYDNLYRAVREGAPLLVSPESARDTYDVLDRIKKGSGF